MFIVGCLCMPSRRGGVLRILLSPISLTRSEMCMRLYHSSLLLMVGICDILFFRIVSKLLGG